MAAVFAAGACQSGVAQGRIEILDTLPHDTAAYTQGLVFHDGALYESTGRYGGSTVRRLDPGTGQVLAVDSLAEDYFGEGLAAVDGRLIQLTWRENVALIYDPNPLALRDSVEVSTHGWGLCHDGESLFMTTGNSLLYQRDPGTLEVEGQLQITRDGAPLWEVNELECVGEWIYANVYRSDTIVRIDKETAEVVEEFDAGHLVPPELRGSDDAVLNGIAFDPETDTFYLTGKLWPVMYRVRLEGG